MAQTAGGRSLRACGDRNTGNTTLLLLVSQFSLPRHRFLF